MAFISGVGVNKLGVEVAVGVFVGVGVGVLVGSVSRVDVGVGSESGSNLTAVSGVWSGTGVKVGGRRLGSSVGARTRAVDTKVEGGALLTGAEQALIAITEK